MLDGRLWWRLTVGRASAAGSRASSRSSCPETFVARLSPLVTMSRNMLRSTGRSCCFRLTLTGLRLLLLRFGQTRTYRRADGLIFLTPYARDQVMEVIGHTKCATIIPHGVDDRFRAAPRAAAGRWPSAPRARRCALLYISNGRALQAPVARRERRWPELRSQGPPARDRLRGAERELRAAPLERDPRRLDPQRRFLPYLGEIPFEKLHELRETPSSSSSRRAARTCRTSCSRRWRRAFRSPAPAAARCRRSSATPACTSTRIRWTTPSARSELAADAGPARPAGRGGAPNGRAFFLGALRGRHVRVHREGRARRRVRRALPGTASERAYPVPP